MVHVLSPPPYRHWLFPVCVIIGLSCFVLNLDYVCHFNPSCLIVPRKVLRELSEYQAFVPRFAVNSLISPSFFDSVLPRLSPFADRLTLACLWSRLCFTIWICLPVSCIIKLSSALASVLIRPLGRNMLEGVFLQSCKLKSQLKWSSRTAWYSLHHASPWVWSFRITPKRFDLGLFKPAYILSHAL